MSLLPLNTTAEVQQWYLMRDEAFVRLADLFTNRFQQLFFRAWSDAHAISQHQQLALARREGPALGQQGAALRRLGQNHGIPPSR